MTLDLLIFVALLHVCLLFGIAFAAERRARTGRNAWVRSPFVYTLSLSVYCTAWTFYGAVGSAARSGLEYLTIYLGPTLVFIGWWWLLRKLVRIGRAQRITSIADLLSARYGKSNGLAVLVVLLAVNLVPLVQVFGRGGEEPWHLWVPALAQITLMTRVLKGEAPGALDALVTVAVCAALAAISLGWIARTLRQAAVR